MRAILNLALAIGVVLGLALPAQAQLLGDLEVRGGVFAHSVDEAMFDASRIEDVNVELLLGLPLVDQMTGPAVMLRPHVGATINTEDLESMVYAGATLTVPLFGLPLFVEGSFGGAIHNGDLDNAVFPARDLGCSVLFRESASLGVQITEAASVMATVEHASHAGLCGDDNRGLTNFGVRVGYKF
jgi:hypothetical protein